MPVGIEELILAQPIRHFTTEHILLVSAVPLLIALCLVVALARKFDGSVWTSLGLFLFVLAFNLLLGACGLVVSDAVIRRMMTGQGNGLAAYFLALGIITLADIKLWFTLRPNKDDEVD